MEQSLKHFLHDPRLLLDAAGEGIYGFDRDGNAVFINPAAERMTGWQASELLGQQIHRFHHHSHADGSDYPACECPIYRTVVDGQPRTISNEVFWRKDGSQFPVEYTSTPIYKDQQLIGAVAIFRDVSQQRSAEQALREALSRVNELSEQLQAENRYLLEEINAQWQDSDLVGQSVIFQQMMQQIELVAKTDSTVLILGENGTGKELIARQLHNRSQRCNAPLVKVNCAAFSASLIESELFGHEKGAFTGAQQRRKGRFELAHKGTLFLDEVAELPLEAQSKLLRVLQEQEFERVGGQQTLKVDIRLIAATNRDLWAMVEQGSFRMDLYYRLNVFPLRVPALRERIEDLELLVAQLLSKLSQKLAKQFTGISARSLNRLKSYHWPGNVRELQNILERAAILTQGPVVHIDDMQLSEAAREEGTEIRTLDSEQKRYIEYVLSMCGGRINGEGGAAQRLGLAPSTLRSKMQKLGVNRE
ncbi:sigma-54 interaction domain-containing protein [Pseudoalteromonas ruthenica]|uniref:sigma-54 interaction domain-containing protein n=1 Tax=Pseudoalteromonas ruthenica TaxID=151081 RepID=UPI00110AA03A|nr:sigma 54-interacting transcriptional regulator [Pseudoalteromonas ruthenica]TMO48929.1 Fis family transcriptional regulator [Pseudoalteromonas ruthenica]TMO51057.1 Fis family transcriptional regulator [Pseudoalteromonas ruthenica]